MEFSEMYSRGVDMKPRSSYVLPLVALLSASHPTASSQVTMTYDIATQCPQLSGRVHLFGTINAGSPGPEAAIFDWNRNGRMDIVLTRTNVTPFRTDIYEFGGVDSLGTARFNIAYSFPVFFSQWCSSFPCPPYVVSIGELTANGLTNLVTWSATDTLRVFEQTELNSYPTRQRFRFHVQGLSNLVLTQGEIVDLDGDGKPELLINIENAHAIYEFNPIDSSLVLAWRDSAFGGGNWTINYGRYAVGDFDGDGLMEFAGGNSYPGGSNDAFVFVYENAANNQFALTWSDTIRGVVNLWLHGSGGDLDSNGKVEFWVGGYTYTDRTLYKFYMYETTGNNSYDSVFVLTVRLPYLGTASVGEIGFGDVDGDGSNEIALSIGDYVLILKPRSPRNFEPIACIPTGTSDSEVWLKDIDGDGRAEIIVSRWFYGSPQTWFYKYDVPVFVPNMGDMFPPTVQLFQNYPNPFNSTTHVGYSLPARLPVQLSLYNILGQRVALLVDATQDAGNHTLEIDSDKNALASGMYVLRLITPIGSVSRKIIVLR
jgi:hypothetical protein